MRNGLSQHCMRGRSSRGVSLRSLRFRCGGRRAGSGYLAASVATAAWTTCTRSCKAVDALIPSSSSCFCVCAVPAHLIDHRTAPAMQLSAASIPGCKCSSGLPTPQQPLSRLSAARRSQRHPIAATGAQRAVIEEPPPPAKVGGGGTGAAGYLVSCLR